MDAWVCDPNGWEPGGFGPHRQVRGLISAGIINNWISYRKFKEAFAIHIALIDLHKRHSKPGGLEIMTIIFARVMDKEETRRQFHTKWTNICASLDHNCFDHRNFITINGFVKAFHGRG